MRVLDQEIETGRALLSTVNALHIGSIIVYMVDYLMYKKQLEELYLNQKLSTVQIGKKIGWSNRKVDYWLKKFEIPKRTISEAVYVRSNPEGDPFLIKEIENKEDAFWEGLGLGLYWGEGTKSNKYSVRLGNTDPRLVKAFIKFLKVRYQILEEKLRFGLQVFSDMDPNEALGFWQRELDTKRDKFGKVIITPTQSIGTYKNKTKYGVLTIYFSNKKLRDLINKSIENIDLS